MFEGLATMVLTPAMALIQDDWIAQKIERTQKHAFTKHPETNSCFDVTQSVPAGRRAGGHTMADPSMLLPGYNTATGQYCYKASQLHAPVTVSHAPCPEHTSPPADGHESADSHPTPPNPRSHRHTSEDASSAGEVEEAAATLPAARNSLADRLSRAHRPRRAAWLPFLRRP